MRILHIGFGFLPLRYGGIIIYAEDVMDAQVARGHDVGYFFPGRRYPVLPADRLRRWERRGVSMFELVNSTLGPGGDAGTLRPQDDLSHPPSEAHFIRVLEEFRPDVVHVQELIGLPTAVIEIARARGVPVVATIQDYLPLCPVIKLYDVDGNVCVRHDVGEQCARCSAWAPEGHREMLHRTVEHDLGARLGGARGGAVLKAAMAGSRVVRRVIRRPAALPAPAEQKQEPPRERAPAARVYQARRDVNVQRLGMLDAMAFQSHRAAEIYATLGVPEARMRVLQFAVSHIEHITAKTISEPPSPVRFATLAGAANVAKGSEVIVGALERLERMGLSDRFQFTALGYIHDGTREALERFPAARWGGFYEPEVLDSVLMPYDVGIVPSVWEESYGYVGVEFLAKGIPVIGNARGGIVEYTRDGETGWVNREASAEGLAAIMAEIVRRPEQVPELNARIRADRARIVKPFAAHVDEIEALYREVVERAGEREAELASARR
jgi:glycosyltransferase involved in cell wall biosynthesis